MTCWSFSSPASCAAPRESADIEVQPVTTSRATRSDRTDVVITLSEGRSRVERQGDASCRDRPVQAEHGGNLPPAVDPAQLDLPARHEAEEEDQRCVFTRRRNSSWSRSITFVVRSVFHWVLGKRKNVRSSSPPSRKLVTTPGQRLAHVRSKAVYATWAASALVASTIRWKSSRIAASACFGALRSRFRSLWTQQRLHRSPRPHQLDGASQPGVTVDDRQ